MLLFLLLSKKTFKIEGFLRVMIELMRDCLVIVIGYVLKIAALGKVLLNHKPLHFRLNRVPTTAKIAGGRTMQEQRKLCAETR